MRRTALLVLVALLLVAVGVVVVAEVPALAGLQSEMPAVARARLDEYLAAVYPSGDVQVQAVHRASHARRFDATMSGSVFGDSVYYQTDIGSARIERDSLLPLPYPPREVWCVLLKQDAAAGSGYRVVFPALYMDMYNADWLVHQAAPDRDPSQTLDAIGCALPLE